MNPPGRLLVGRLDKRFVVQVFGLSQFSKKNISEHLFPVKLFLCHSSNVDYSVSSRHTLSIDGTEVIFLNVNLVCDTQLTPWCNCTGCVEIFIEQR